MQLYSLSLEDIENDLASFFAGHFNTDPSKFPPAANVKTMFNLSTNAWEQMGDVISEQNWMRQIGVVLGPNDMDTVSTVGQVAYLIFKRIKHVVTQTVASKPSQLTPLVKLAASAKSQSTKPRSRKSSRSAARGSARKRRSHR